MHFSIFNKLYFRRKHYTFPYRCSICNRGFRYKERFDGHLREHEGKRVKKNLYFCFSYIFEFTLQSIIQAAVCEWCGREYSKWSGLQQHVKLAHKGEETAKYTCYCGKSFMYESGLVTHRLTHTGPRKFICESCGKVFPDSYQLNVSA